MYKRVTHYRPVPHRSALPVAVPANLNVRPSWAAVQLPMVLRQKELSHPRGRSGCSVGGPIAHCTRHSRNLSEIESFVAGHKDIF